MRSPAPESTSPGHLRRRACFSFAAYANTIIAHLRSAGVPIAAGLTDIEFTAVESALRFKFPPDLRMLLAVGLPTGPEFPNWRSGSLHGLLRLPISRRAGAEAAPVLVPVYGRCYISAEPEQAGNPVFAIGDGKVQYAGFDLAGFFAGGGGGAWAPVWLPAWAAAAPRRVEYWSELAEEGRWWEIECCSGNGSPEGLRQRLLDGGWAEEEVAEMLAGGSDDLGGEGRHVRDLAGLEWHVRWMSRVLRHGGWSPEDVGYALGGLHEPSSVGPV